MSFYPISKEKIGQYRREYFVDRNLLNNFEYELLPLEIKMAYADSIYGSKISEMISKDQKYLESYGYIPEIYTPYFEANGCTFENFDFGREEYEIRLNNPSKKLVVSRKHKKSLNNYIKGVRLAKAKAFESATTRYYSQIINAVNNGSLDLYVLDIKTMLKELENNSVNHLTFLTEEEKEEIIKAELFYSIEAMKKNKEPKALDKLPQKYLTVLNKLLTDYRNNKETKKI